MKLKECKDLLYLSDECPKCKTKLDIECQKQFDGVKVYFLKCWKCGFEYDG